MWLFHNKNKYEYEYDNIYSLKKYVDKKKIIFYVFLVVLILLALILITYYTIDTRKRISKEESFEKQVIEYQQKVEENKRKEEERQAKIPKLTDEGKENIKHIYKSDIKRAFITFDDGPSNNTGYILDILKEKNVKATFFVLGMQAEKFPETLKRIYDEGHYIANHGYSHSYSNIYSSPEEVLNEYNKCNQIVANSLGVPEYNSHLFRFPGGSVGGKYKQIKSQAIPLLEQNGIVYVDWNALTGDSEKQNPSEEYLMNNLQQTTKGKNSLVVLMHDSEAKKITADTLPEVIEYLQQEGYQFQNFYDVMK